MSEEPALGNGNSDPRWVTNLAGKRPDFVLMAPFMIYLLLLGLNDLVPESYMPWAIAVRGMGGLYVVWLLRRHLPPLGKAHLGLALIAGVLVAAGWVAGQHLFNRIGMGGRLFLFPGIPEAVDPRLEIGACSWWSQAVLRISVASITVPFVEELFWRAFLLRALINWDRFENVPLGKFTWFSFVGTSLLSVLEHPNNWAVSILCWFVYNALMYWKKSILLLIITHGITNLALYIYVIAAGDWLFW